MQPESLFKLKVQKRLAQIPNLYAEKIQQVCIRGTPDMIIFYKGWGIAWELKCGKNKVKKGSLQEHKLGKIASTGCIAREVNPENLDAMIEELECLPDLSTLLSNYLVNRP